MRLALLILALVALVIVPFALWGEPVEELLALDSGTEWLRGFGPWTAVVIVLLLVGDVLLPIPTTPLITAAGILYGAVLGGVIGAVGSVLAGMTAFGIARLFGPSAARRLVGARDFARLDRFFSRWGGWAIALSRWLPVLPEVLAGLAGLSGMRPGRVLLAVLCGSVPMAFAYAAIGAWWTDRPGLALIIGAVIPALLWPLTLPLRRDPVERAGDAETIGALTAPPEEIARDRGAGADR